MGDTIAAVFRAYRLSLSKDFVLIEKISALIDAHKMLQRVPADNRFPPNFKDREFPQSTNFRIVFLPIPVHSAASSIVKPILTALIFTPPFVNTRFATMYL